MLDFRIETFLTVCQTMNFTVAAKQLNITQPAVSQHIHFLEEEYDTALFIYKNKRLSLTNSGALLRKRLLTMKNDEKAVMAELKSSSTGFVFLPFTLISNRQSSILHNPGSASGIYHIQAVNCSMTVYNCLPCPISDRYKNCNSAYGVYQYLPSFLQPQLL